MLTLDPSELIFDHQQFLLEEARHAQLAAQLPARQSAVRRGLALVCYRLAAWLDAPAGYVQLPETGPEDLWRPMASM
jgi:hypothetical protein